MLPHDLLVAIALGLLCGIDGCVLAACAVGSRLRLKPWTLGAVAFIGHMVNGTVGVVSNSFVGLAGAGWVEILSALALGFLAYRIISPQHVHPNVEKLSLFALAFLISGDAVPAGIALYGEALHSATPQTMHIIAGSILNAVSALTVGIMTAIAAALFNKASSNRFFDRIAPAIAGGMISLLAVRAVWKVYYSFHNARVHPTVDLYTGAAIGVAVCAYLFFRKPQREECGHH